jgi:hypothetical protein
MSRSVHETVKQLVRENPTRKDVDALDSSDHTVSQLEKKRQYKKEKLNQRKKAKLESSQE